MAVIWVAVSVVACIMLIMVYNRFIRKIIYTPERVAAHTQTFEEWKRGPYKGATIDNQTDADMICDYLSDTVYHALAQYRSLHPDDDIILRTSYINAAINAHYRELPHVTGWEYIPDIRKLIPPRSDGDDQFLLNNHDMCIVAEHYRKTLRRDHWYDRYQFESSVIAEWYSWLPMCAVFYDDGTMDLFIAT